MHAVVFLLLMPVFSSTADECRYEFIVPQNDAVKCSGNTEALANKVSHLETIADYERERSNAIASTLGKEITKIEEDTKKIWNTTGTIIEDIMELKLKVASFRKTENDVQHLKDMVTHENDSLKPKFIDLQAKIMNIAQDIFDQRSEMRRKVSELQQQILQQQTVLRNHGNAIQVLTSASLSVQTIVNKTNVLEEMREADAEWKRSINTRVETMGVKLEPVPDQIRRLESAINLLQNMVTTSVRKIQNDVKSLQSDEESKLIHGIKMTDE